MVKLKAVFCPSSSLVNSVCIEKSFCRKNMIILNHKSIYANVSSYVETLINSCLEHLRQNNIMQLQSHNVVSVDYKKKRE